MIELTAQDGSPVTINLAAIWHLRSASGHQTAIYSASGAVLFVRENYAAVRGLLSEAQGTVPASLHAEQ